LFSYCGYEVLGVIKENILYFLVQFYLGLPGLPTAKAKAKAKAKDKVIMIMIINLLFRILYYTIL